MIGCAPASYLEALTRIFLEGAPNLVGAFAPSCPNVPTRTSFSPSHLDQWHVPIAIAAVLLLVTGLLATFALYFSVVRSPFTFKNRQTRRFLRQPAEDTDRTKAVGTVQVLADQGLAQSAGPRHLATRKR